MLIKLTVNVTLGKICLLKLISFSLNSGQSLMRKGSRDGGDLTHVLATLSVMVPSPTLSHMVYGPGFGNEGKGEVGTEREKRNRGGLFNLGMPSGTSSRHCTF